MTNPGRAAALLAAAFFVLPGLIRAQETCPDVEDQEDLRKIPEIVAPAGARELSTTFDVQLKTMCVTTGTKVGTRTKPDGTTVNVYSAKPVQLRTYVYPDPNTGQPAWGLPGPTLRLRKAGDDGKGGQGLAILLKNSLPVASDTTCASACPSTVAACKCDPASLDALVKKCSAATSSDCCCVINCTQKAPNCFHGDNTTNLHFHGSRVSPQEPQDFVLLELRPGTPPAEGSADHADGAHGAHGAHGKVAYGQFQYRVDPFGSIQPEGTHWYHPHKHGSVGMQVANGMAGALIIEGPFDDLLNGLLKGPEEKLMVIQQIAPATNLFRQGIPRPVLVNGQVSPRITVKPGELQRWRIVNATMSSQAMLQITFDPRLSIRQIAMDGIRFSPVNYACQPLANFDPSNPPAAFPCDPNAKFTQLTLAPGNRADFLVQMPLQESSAENLPLRVERRLFDLADEEGSQRQLLREQDEAIAPGIPEPALFHVDVDDGIEGNDHLLKTLAAGAPTIPEKLDLAMPEHFSTAIVPDQQVAMTFQQVAAVTNVPWPYTASPMSEFKIDGRQFDGTCANVTTTIGTTAKWTVSNATQLPHPFHIHTNPFLLVEYNGVPLQAPGSHRPEPVWMDTMPLPLAKLTPCADPAQCPGAIPCKIGSADLCTLGPSSMVFLHRYELFTGQYVLHCHFLGHEDRGMMFSVQTVCSGRYPTSAGKYGYTNRPEECAGPGPFPDPLPACK